MKNAMLDIRGIIAATIAALAMIGFVVLSLSGDAEQAKELAALFGLPALTFLFGLASDPFAISE
jgi:hypothetical protein